MDINVVINRWGPKLMHISVYSTSHIYVICHIMLPERYFNSKTCIVIRHNWNEVHFKFKVICIPHSYCISLMSTVACHISCHRVWTGLLSIVYVRNYNIYWTSPCCYLFCIYMQNGFMGVSSQSINLNRLISVKRKLICFHCCLNICMCVSMNHELIH